MSFISGCHCTNYFKQSRCRGVDEQTKKPGSELEKTRGKQIYLIG